MQKKQEDFGGEMITLKDVYVKFKGWWGSSLAAIIAFGFGFFLGVIQTEGRVLNDCKYIGSFRVDSQGFECTRRI